MNLAAILSVHKGGGQVASRGMEMGPERWICPSVPSQTETECLLSYAETVQREEGVGVGGRGDKNMTSIHYEV